MRFGKLKVGGWIDEKYVGVHHYERFAIRRLFAPVMASASVFRPRSVFLFVRAGFLFFVLLIVLFGGHVQTDGAGLLSFVEEFFAAFRTRSSCDFTSTCSPSSPQS